MRAVELKCPHCGAFIPREISRCNYCGTHVILEKNAFAMEKLASCQSCGSPCEQDSWFCVNCGAILTSDSRELGMLKEQQRKLRFMQTKVKDQLPKEIKRELKPDEYVHFHYKGLGTPHEVVTEKRILKFSTGWFIKRENLKSAPWSEVVGISEPWGGIANVWFLDVTTFAETFRLDFQGIADAIRFRNFCIRALGNHNLRKRDILSTICSLSLGKNE